MADDVQTHGQRLRRDKYLAAAAGVLVVGYLLNAAWVAYWYGAPLSLTHVSVSEVLGIAGQVARAAGFALVTVGFLVARSRRDRIVRRAAWVHAGGTCASFLALALYLFVRVCAMSSLLEPFSTELWVGWGVQLAFFLFLAVAALLIASAFARKNEGSRRNRLLAWASVATGVGFGLWLLYDLISSWGGFDMMDAQEATQLGADVFLVLGAVVAAIGFFAVAKPRYPLSLAFPVHRERVLVYAAMSLALSYLLEAVGKSILLWDAWRLPESFGFSFYFTYDLLDALVSIAFMVASVLAAVGFTLSSRSTPERAEATR